MTGLQDTKSVAVRTLPYASRGGADLLLDLSTFETMRRRF
jgi:hypothetical protein